MKGTSIFQKNGALWSLNYTESTNMNPIYTSNAMPQRRILRWEDVAITSEHLIINLRWGEVRIGLDMHYWTNSPNTGVSAYLKQEDRWTHDCFVAGSTIPCCEPDLSQLDYVFDTVAKTITTHWPGKRLVRSAPKHIGTNMGGDVYDDSMPRTYDINPGDFKFSNTTV